MSGSRLEVINLRLFAPDDSRLEPSSHPYIDVQNVTPYGWKMHCLEAFAQKQVEFDLMSADINFSTDDTDPGLAEGQKSNSWGLVHALVGLARRNPTDRYRNRLPFVWEVRSIQPDLIEGDASAIRLYGFLRALLAQRKDNESLEECIVREHVDRTRNDRADQSDLPEWAGKPLPSLLFNDLISQQPQTWELYEIIRSLLPRWRASFIDAVKRRDVRLHVTTMQKQLVQLRAKKRQVDPGTIYIPIADFESGNFRYGISLLSAMADCAKISDANQVLPIEFDAEFERIAIPDKKYPRTPTGWYEYLHFCAEQSLKHIDARWLRDIGVRAEKNIEDGTLADLIDSLDYVERALLFCILVARVHAIGKEYSNLSTLRVAYGITWNDNKFFRPFTKRSHIFPRLGGTNKMAKNIVSALLGTEHKLGACWDDWMRDGFKLWIESVTLPAQREFVLKRVPGLFLDPRPENR